MKQITIIFILLSVCINIFAQEYTDGHFVYEDANHTIIKSLSESGISYIKTNNELTIPAGVETVRRGAFSQLSSYSATLSTLNIEGNTLFEKADGSGRLSSLDVDGNSTTIQSDIETIYMGSNMSQENMHALLLCLETRHSLTTVEISGNVSSINWTDEPIKNVLTSNVSVDLPATMVTNQVFGDAKVYGVFATNYDYSTTCVGATFVDADDGSNLLFYIPTETLTGEKKVRFHRVHYINANQGVLLHREQNTANHARLLRIDNVSDYVDGLNETDKAIYEDDQASYQKNMLRGSVSPQTISATYGEYTNMILYNGAFVPTSGGTLGANKAYLQVPTSYLGGGGSGAKVLMDFGGELTEISTLDNRTIDNMTTSDNAVYDLQGRKVADNHASSIKHYALPKGIYIHNGKKIIRK